MLYLVIACIAFALGYFVAALISIEREQRELEELFRYPPFTVIDKQTGKQADIEDIVRNDEWVKGLMANDMEGFAITDAGDLILMDECGNFAYCDRNRFEIRPKVRSGN